MTAFCSERAIGEHGVIAAQGELGLRRTSRFRSQGCKETQNRRRGREGPEGEHPSSTSLHPLIEPNQQRPGHRSPDGEFCTDQPFGCFSALSTIYFMCKCVFVLVHCLVLGRVWLFAAHDCSPASPLCTWDFPGKNTGVGSHFLLQGIFLTLGSNPHLPGI